MKKVFCPVIAHTHIAFYRHLAEALRKRDFDTTFAAFYPREHLLLTKNGHTAVVPQDPWHLDAYRHQANEFSDAEAKEILHFSFVKGGGNYDDWVARLQDVGKVIASELKPGGYTVALIWNGEEFIGRATAVLAARYGVPAVYMENGYFSNTLQIDAAGVNASSSIVDLPFSDIQAELGRFMGGEADQANGTPLTAPETRGTTRLDDLKLWLRRILSPNYYKHFPENKGGSTLRSWMMQRKHRAIPMDDIGELPARFVFIPFQVHDDTQILLNSPHFQSMETFFEHCYSVIRKVCGPDISIIVKEHPEDLLRKSYDSLKKRHPDVIWLRKFDLNTLLDRATCIMVVNSSVGLQSITKKRPTVVFGRSFYTRPEICFPINSPTETAGILKAALDGVTPAMAANIDAFETYLREIHFTRGSWKNPNVQDASLQARRIAEMVP